MLDLFGAAGFESVTLALDLDVFEEIGDGDLEADDVADRIDAHPEATEALLDFLAVNGYLATDGDTYTNTSMTDRWLRPSSETNFAPWLVAWSDLVFPFWEEHLETAIREGEPPETIYEWCGEDEERWRVLQEGFRAAGRIGLDDVMDALTIPDDDGNVIDVGGGHGLFSIELCRRYPTLSATLFDLPGVLGLARESAEEAGVEDRFTLRGGDYRTDDLGEGYDLALLFNVIHAHDGPENVALFERVADSLAPGGRITVMDQLEGSGRTPVARAGLRFVALTYRTTLGATIHPYESVEGWLQEAGFEDVSRTSVGPVAGNALIEATLPGEETA